MRFLLLLLITSHFATAQTARTVRTYDGTINDKYPVSLTLTTDDNLAYGTLIYKRSGIPIRVVGTVDKESLWMHEFTGQSTITGIFNGKPSAKGYLGWWIAPKSTGKELTFSLTQTSRNSDPNGASLPALNPTGTYAYNFGKEASFGTMYVQQTTGNQVLVVLESSIGPPSYNMATLDKTRLKLKGNQAIYSTTEYGKCTIKFTFFEGGASVVYVGNDSDCGFGHNATITGNYLKTSSRIPTFPKVN